MDIEQTDCGKYKVATFHTNEEVCAVGVGLLMLEHYTDPEIVEIGTYRARMEYEGKVLKRDSGTFSLTTEHAHEGILLGGLIWVAQERDHLATEMFAETVALRGVASALSSFTEISLGTHFDELTEIAQQLAADEEINEIFTKYFQ